MFKTAASKLAHNTTLPALGGNQDLRPLQDLITAEKTVIIALQKLSSDYSKAAEALRAWGQAEGDDLGDILSASTALLAQFSSAISQYAAHGHTIRDTLKSIRSREEALDELKRRRRTVHRKAEDADKKLSKMSPEHKHLETQTELLYRLQDEIRSLDSEIMSEEAMLGDFKRSATRAWLGLKFGGLVECSEKGAIVGSYGKLLVAEIPEEITQPGMPRSLYYGHSKINALVNDAIRGVGMVALDNAPNGGGRLAPLPGIPPKEPSGSLDSPIGGGYPVPPPSAGGDGHFGPRGSPPLLPPQSTGGGNSLFGGPPSLNTNTMPNPASKPPLPLDTSGPLSPISQPAIDEFGLPVIRHEGGGAGGAGRFATFPVKLRQDSLPTSVTSPGTSTHQHPQHPPSFDFLHSPLTPPSLNLNTRSDLGADSFSLSIAEALEGKKDALGEESAWKGRLSGSSDLPPPTPAKPSAGGGGSAFSAASSAAAASASLSSTSPQLLSTTSTGTSTGVGANASPNANPMANVTATNNRAFPETNPWATPPKEDFRHLSASLTEPQHQHQRSVSEQLSDNDSALLAYMTGAAGVDVESSDEDDEEEGEAAVVTRRTQQQQAQQGQQGVGVGAETKEDGKGALGLRPSNDSKPPRIQSYRVEVVQGDEYHDGGDSNNDQGSSVHSPPRPQQQQQQPQPPSPESKRVARVPPPTFEPQSPPKPQQQPEKDRQKEMDAAAARELTKELEEMDFVPPKISSSSLVSPEEEAAAEHAHAPAPGSATGGGGSVPTSPRRQQPVVQEPQQLSQQQQQQQQQFAPPDREPSPLIPPSAPFAQRAVSPQAFAESQLPPALSSPPRLRQAGSPPAHSAGSSFQLQDPGSASASPLSSPKPTAAQAIAQAYHQQQQLGQGSVGGSGNGYDTVYPPPHQQQQQQQQQQIPPRFQAAYGHESQGGVPPRFQGMRTGSSPVPPRFQNQSQQPPFEGGGGEQLPRSSVESLGGGGAGGGSPMSSPYRTPLEYPGGSSNASSPRLGGGLGLAGVGAGGGGGGGGSPGSNPSALSAASSPLVPAGARTISAAAFKRPQPNPSATLPPRGFGSSGPYPVINAPPPGQGQGQGQQLQQQQQQGPTQQQLFSSSELQNATANTAPSWQQHPKQHLRVSRDLPPPPPGAAPPRPESEYYDSSFDYIGAYAHSDQGSPMSGEFPQNSNSNTHPNPNPNPNYNNNRHSGGPRPMSGVGAGGGYYPNTGNSGVPAGLSPGQVIPSSAAQHQQALSYQHQGGVGGYPNNNVSMSGSGGAAQPPSVLSPGYGQGQQQMYGRYSGGGDEGLR